MVQEPDPRLKPELAYGDLVAVTTVGHQAEAEMLRDMLLDEGIPSTFRPARSFDPRYMLGASRYEVLVRESGYDAAYELVHGRPPDLRSPTDRSSPEPGTLLALILLGLGLIALVVWLSGNV